MIQAASDFFFSFTFLLYAVTCFKHIDIQGTVAKRKYFFMFAKLEKNLKSLLSLHYLHSFATYSYPALNLPKCALIAAVNSVIRHH